MKTIAVLAVIALLIVAAIIYFSDRDLGLAPIKSGLSSSQAQDSPPAAGTPGGFTEVANALEQEMHGIPSSLDAAGVPLRTAFNVKSRLAAAASTRKEYQALVQACDLIIYADQEHSVRQARVRQSQQNVSGDPMANAKANQTQNTAERSSIHAKAQADWETYRRQTDQEVTRLLGSL